MIDQSHNVSDLQARNTFALVDGAQIPELLAELYRAAPHLQWRSLYHATHLEPLIDMSPILCDISDTPHLQQWLAKTFDNIPWGIVISSQGSFDDTWHHLQSICWVSNSMGEQVLLRYYDPRIAAKLFQIKHESIQSLLGPIEQIWIPGKSTSHPQLTPLELPDSSSFGPQELKAAGWFVLQPFHEQAIESAHEDYLNTTIASHVREYFPDKWSEIPDTEQDHWVRRRIDQARSLGLESPQDLLLLTNIICVLGENCLADSNHPAIQLLNSKSPKPLSERLNQAATLLENKT